MKRTVLIALLLALSVLSSDAQSTWQWGRRGGSADNAGNYGLPDGPVDIATDKWGNVYVLSTVYSDYGGFVDIEGHTKPTHALDDIVIASFDCSGNFRWMKDLGSDAGDMGRTIKTDTLGGVYLTGRISGIIDYGHAYIDSDTVLAYTNKSMFIMKYDTGGNYKWFVMPQSDTVSVASETYTGSLDMDVDGAGNIHVLCELPPGGYAGGAFVTTVQGVYMLRYNAAGAFVAGHKMDITATAGFPATYGTAVYSMRMARDFQRQRYYMTGVFPYYYHTVTLQLGTVPINESYYVTCYNDTGGMVWTRQNTDTLGDGIEWRPALDDSGNIYIAGGTAIGDTFNGYAFTNVLTNLLEESPFVVKLDKNGNNVWVINTSSTQSNNASGIAISGNTLGVTGDYNGELKMGNFLVNNAIGVGTAYRPFFCQIDKRTGVVLSIDSLTPGGCFAIPLAADRFGNFFIGGQFSGTLYVAEDTLYNLGGEYDFCVAKFGTSNCDIAGLGNSNVSITRTPIRIFPNPVTDELAIENATPGTIIKLFNVMGQQVYAGVINEAKRVINMQFLTAGTYIVQLTDKEGNRVNKTLVKL